MTSHTTVSDSSSSKSLVRRSAVLALITALAVGGSSVYVLRQFQSSQPTATSEVPVTPPVAKTVTALGRLEPKGEIIKVSAPTSANGSRVKQLLVKEGDRVKAGQVMAILDSRDRLEAALGEAQERVKVAQAELARTLAGAKQGEIAAQRAAIARIEAERSNDLEAQAATVARLEAELQTAEVDYQRYQMLYNEGASSTQERDKKRLEFASAQRRLQEARANLNRIRSAQQQQLNEARATLDKIAEVRPVDVQVAKAEVTSAQAAVKRAQAELEDAYVRASEPGQVIKIHARPGELVSSENGIAEIGQTQQMYAIAEVYESDVSQIRPGQLVRVTSDSIPGELRGKVEQVGLQVLKQNVVNTDPSANIDARVVEVKVQLDQASSQKAAGFTNLQVDVVITL